MAALLPLIFMVVLMWFFLIRPQQQRVRRQQALVSSLRVGDEVITASGIFGRIVELDDESASVEVSPGVTLRMVRHAVSQRLGEEEQEADVEDYPDDEECADVEEYADVEEHGDREEPE